MPTADGVAERVATIGAALAALVAALVLVGWIIGSTELTTGGTEAVPMQFNTALASLCAALALLLEPRRWRPALGLTLPVVLLALPGVVQELFVLDLGVDQLLFRHDYVAEGVPPGRMALNSGLALLLTVLSLVVLVRWPRAERALLVVYACGFVVAAIGLLSLSGFALDLVRARSWGAATPMALMTALAMSGLGLAQLARGWRVWGAMSRRALLVANVVALLFVAVTILLWAKLAEQQHAVLAERVEANLDDVSDLVLDRISERAGSIAGLARHVERNLDQADAEWFAERAGLLQRDVAALDRIVWADEQGRVRWASSIDQLPMPAIGDDLDEEPTRGEGFERARATGGPVLTAPLELRFRGRGALLIVPMSRNGDLVGYLATGVPWAELLGPLVEGRARGYLIDIRDGGVSLYARGNPASAATELHRSRELDVLGRTWRLELAPTPGLAAALRDRLPEAVLVAGLVNGGLVTLSLGLAGVAAQRRREAEDAREKMARNEQRFRQLFDLSPLPMWLFDRGRMRFLEVNRAATEQYGWSRDEFLALGPFDIRPPDERERLMEFLRRGTPPPSGKAGLWRHVRRDGSEFLADVVVHDFDEEGVSGRLVLSRDVTDAEAARRALETQAQIIDQVAGAIAETDMKGVVRRWNRGAERLLGYSAEEMLGRSVAALYPKLDRGELREHLIAPLIEHGHHEAEVVYLHRDGHFVDAYISLSLIRDQSGAPTGMLAFSLDLAERRRAEAELKLLRRALEASVNGVVIADARAADQPVIYVNPAFEALTGYAREDTIGRNCRFLQGRDRDQPEIGELHRALAEGRDCQVVLRNYRREGTLFWNELSVSPVRDRDGEVSHFIGIQTNVTERRLRQLELEHRASHDELTNLPNRNAIREEIDRRVGEVGERVGVVLLNLDRLHHVNDTLGHAAGDLLLVEVAGRLMEFAGEISGRVGRMGGDEFAVVLGLAQDEDPSASLPAQVARLFELVAEPAHVRGLDLHMTCSAGASWSPEAGNDATALLGNADLAMNRAKALGRNRVVLFSEALAAAAADRIELGGELREAMLVDDQLELHYQPLVDAATGSIAGAEALLRWNNPRRGMVSPGRFIPVAEDTGAIVDLGRWALRRACRQGRGWGDDPGAALGVSVNVSSVQLQRTEFVQEVLDAMASSGLAAGRLKLEITESVVMQDTEGTLAALRRLREAGVRISLDDFGTGYSSLGYLRQLPIDELKIDRMFIADIPGDAYAATLCRAIIDMSRQLGLPVVAEGVETAEQARFLAGAGCRYLQGFLFSRPLPAAAFAALAEAGARWSLDGVRADAPGLAGDA